MAVGYPKTRDVLNSRLGQLVTTQQQLIDAYARLKASVDGMTDAELTGPDFGYTQTEANQIRSLVTDLNNGGQVFIGRADPPSGRSNCLYWAGPDKLRVTAFD